VCSSDLAARALLDWSQEQLAEACDLSVATIRKIESGHISPRGSTMGGIKSALELAGLEFLDPSGVRLRPEEIRIFRGRDGLVAFFDEVYAFASTQGGAQILQVCHYETPFTEALGRNGEVYRQNMASIKERFTLNCILTKDPTNIICSAYCEYRYIPAGVIESVPFYVYDDKYAIIVFDKNNSPTVTIIDSAPIAEAFRRQFYSMWDKATPLNTVNRGKSKR
jgi:transcriptional regulator with XRE-family HTH domain